MVAACCPDRKLRDAGVFVSVLAHLASLAETAVVPQVYGIAREVVMGKAIAAKVWSVEL
jgi:hypothetical protein